MSDQIYIRDLLVRGILGINDDERTQRQDILLNLVLSVDTRPAARSDDIADAVNYRTLTKQVIDHVEASQCLLVERLAEEVARLCLHDGARLSRGGDDRQAGGAAIRPLRRRQHPPLAGIEVAGRALGP